MTTSSRSVPGRRTPPFISEGLLESLSNYLPAPRPSEPLSVEEC